jgi:hypothetical protein
MTLKEAITLFGYHQRSNVKTRTVQSYRPLLQKFAAEFGERSFDSIGSDGVGGHPLDGCFTWKISNITPRIINRNLQSLGYVPTLFLNKPGSFLWTDFNPGRRVLPVTLFFKFNPPIQYVSGKWSIAKIYCEHILATIWTIFSPPSNFGFSDHDRDPKSRAKDRGWSRYGQGRFLMLFFC